MITGRNLIDAWTHWAVLALKECEQDPRWHPEGNAFIHTKKVVEKAVLEFGLNLKNADDGKLVLAIILHDIGKVPTRAVQDDGTITHRGHGEVGSGMAWCAMDDLDIDQEDRMDVFWLVKNHMFTLHSAKNASDKTLRKYMNHPMWKNLVRLGLADSQIGIRDDVEYVMARAANIRLQEE